MHRWIEALPGAAGSEEAVAEFLRAMRWIAIGAVVMVAAGLWYLSFFAPLTVNMVIAATLGLFFTVLLGCGLFAVAFFSARSGHDQTVTDATRGAVPVANPDRLPDGLESYRRTAEFTADTIPAALCAEHRTKAGSWGLIHVGEGQLRYRVTDPHRAPLDTILTPETAPGIVEPDIAHQVEPLGPVRFHVEFWR